MNVIWTIIILFSFCFSLFTNNINTLINSIFLVPKNSLQLLLNIGSLIVIYNGIFQIALDAQLIKQVSKVFKGIVKKIFNDIDEETEQLICANVCANVLGLGVATTPIALEIMAKINHNDKLNNNILCLIGINICSFTFFPLTPLTIRNSVNGSYNAFIWLIITIISFITSLMAILIGKKWRFNDLSHK